MFFAYGPAWSGLRCAARSCDRQKAARLFTGNGHDWTHRYPDQHGFPKIGFVQAIAPTLTIAGSMRKMAAVWDQQAADMKRDAATIADSRPLIAEADRVLVGLLLKAASASE